MRVEAQITQVRYVIQQLELVRQQPRIYIGLDARNVLHFIHGFNTACHALGLTRQTAVPDEDAIYMRVVAERGWSWGQDIVTQMQARGFGYARVVDEALAIEIEVWKQCYYIS